MSWGNLDSSWGDEDKHTNAPTDKGYTKIYSAEWAFAALKADGSITTWGGLDNWSWEVPKVEIINTPTDKGYIARLD
jgi:hypothetical protein